MKIFQEFYCTKSGGGCGGYILIKLNIDINGVVEIQCPKCGHAHQRYIDKGEIKDQNRHSKSPVQVIESTLAAWSDSARLIRAKNERDAAIPQSKKDFLDERLLELYGDKLAS